MSQAADFKAIRLKLASPEEILGWSHGEVVKPETINYRTQKPERDGLFDEKIFGPVKDWECACGKYKRVRYKGVVCDKCGVEVTRAIVRRERMGHISLAAPVAHIWFLRGVPSNLSIIFDISVQNLEKVVYFAEFIITSVNGEMKEDIKKQIDSEAKAKRGVITNDYNRQKTTIKNQFAKKRTEAGAVAAAFDDEENSELSVLERSYEEKNNRLQEAGAQAERELDEILPLRILSKADYQDLALKYGQVFEASIGAEALREILGAMDIPVLIARLEAEVLVASPNKRPRVQRRLKLLKVLTKNNIRPEWMMMTVLPVLPPDLRPMVPLDGGRYASSDLNDLYRRVINRNNRLKRLVELNAPEVIVRNEKRMLQEAVDALIDNSARRTKTVTASTGQRRQLRSIADTLRGKQGRFRQNLLGKRVDYSGRSVIVVGPKLQLHQCGLPKSMALELFKPFVISQLIRQGYCHNVRSATRLIEQGEKHVWDILESITSDSYVLLNRAPTLHRLSVQAFQPILIEGKAIQLHPLVCPPFNADFDGDQMAVHVPLTDEARAEARDLMLSSRNILKPATGDPVTVPNQDIVWGIAYLTSFAAGEEKKGEQAIPYFSSFSEVLHAVHVKKIGLRDKIIARVNDDERRVTTAGRIIFALSLPAELRDYDRSFDKKSLRDIIRTSLDLFGSDETAKLLDKIKALSFRYLTRSGLSWGKDDLPELPAKQRLLEAADEQLSLIQQHYENGLLTAQERHVKIIELWTHTKDEVTALAKLVLPTEGTVFSMVSSGARGSWGQIVQMMGMKGLVTNPQGEMIELPVKRSFKEGVDVLEYFISTHGARKGLADTALRTANAGYLTRRLVDVAQSLIVTELDCGDTTGVVYTKAESKEMGETLATRLVGRVLAADVKSGRKKVAKIGDWVDLKLSAAIAAADPDEVRLFSVLTCQSFKGLCQKCYGWDLGYNQPVRLGAAVGIIAAQSIGEPGTQLTMRTFHTGGVAGQDITQGLPRVEEIFENRPVKNHAILSDIAGQVKLGKDAEGKVQVTVRGVGEDKSELVREYEVPTGVSVVVAEGDLVVPGSSLTEGHVDLAELYNLRGRLAVQKYVLREIQSIYSSQGQKLNDRHVEIISRQMFSRVSVTASGDTNLLPGEIISRPGFDQTNQEVVLAGGQAAVGQELLLGITRVSLSTDSFLSAASFQETARVLINAAITGKIDRLQGLKENVIIGRLVPVGTGYKPSLEVAKESSNSSPSDRPSRDG